MTGEIVGRSFADAVLKTERPPGTHQNDIFFPTIGPPNRSHFTSDFHKGCSAIDEHLVVSASFCGAGPGLWYARDCRRAFEHFYSKAGVHMLKYSRFSAPSLEFTAPWRN